MAAALLSDASGTWLWGPVFPSSRKREAILPSAVLPCTGGVVYGSQPSPWGRLILDANPVKVAGC